MDIINRIVAAGRKKRFQTTEQLSLGEFIDKLKECIDTTQIDKNVEFDFEYCYPTGLDSWRGSYDELALTFEMYGYNKTKEDASALEINKFIELCEESLGKTYTGWKGGYFTMTKDTPLWVANCGNSGNTAVVDVLDNGYEVVIITKWMEY